MAYLFIRSKRLFKTWRKWDACVYRVVPSFWGGFMLGRLREISVQMGQTLCRQLRDIHLFGRIGKSVG